MWQQRLRRSAAAVALVLVIRRLAGWHTLVERSLFLGMGILRSIVIGWTVALVKRLVRGKPLHTRWSIAREAAFGGARSAIEYGAELFESDPEHFRAVTALAETLASPLAKIAGQYGCTSIPFQLPSGIRCAAVSLKENEHAVRSRLLRGESSAGEDRLVYALHAHGGGYCALGISSAHQASMRSLFFCRDLDQGTAGRLVVVHVDYSLGVDHKWPRAIVDFVESFDFLVGKGIEGNRVFLFGESGGGGLAACSLLAIRDRPEFLGKRAPAVLEHQPAGAVLLSPMLELDHDYSYESDSLDFLTARIAQVCSKTYCPREHVKSPYASPWNAEYLGGLPPILIQTGAEEIFHESCERFAARVLDHGGQLTFQPFEGMTHCFQHVVLSGCEQTQKSIQAILHFFHENAPLLEERDAEQAK